MDIDHFKKICIVGWGRSGMSLCSLLLSLRKEVRVSEARESRYFFSKIIDEFAKGGVKFEFGGHSQSFIKNSQLLILSPGVNTFNSPAVKGAHTFGIPCVGEIEFSFWLTEAKIIAITGTNGKTTTSYLTYKILKEKRKRVFLGGNIGIPLSSFVSDTKKGDIIVLETSSFQLETIFKFRPYVAAFLNIESDHLDRYADFGDYFEAKLNIFRNQQNQDWTVLNKSLDLRNSIERRVKSKIVHFSKEFPNENLSCAYKIGSIFGLNKAECANIFSAFKGLPHRLQFVKRAEGVNFINDSKATNPSSAVWALKNIKTPIILLAGGKDKGLDFSLVNFYLKRVKKINLFGEASSKIKESLNSNVELEVFSSLEEAVASAHESAKSGDTILFSPMCASFDMFLDYKERGDKFIEIVNSLEEKRA